MERSVDKDEVKEGRRRAEGLVGDVQEGDGVDEFGRQLVQHLVESTALLSSSFLRRSTGSPIPRRRSRFRL